MRKSSLFLSRLAESATIAMSRKSREMKKKGIEVINLSLGEPDFNTPDHIKEAALRGMQENYTHYMAVNGYEDLREAIAYKFKRDNHLNYSTQQIVVSTGAKQTLANLFFSLINPGDEVILPAPYWVTYIEQIKMVQGNPVVLPTTLENSFKISPEQLEKAISPKTRIFLLNSPSNPSGALYTPDEIIALGEVLKKYPHVLILSDEIYEHIRYGGELYSIGTDPELYDRVITVNGVSKAFAMTGWRIGFMGAPEWIAKGCTQVQGQITSGASSIAQRAALEAVLTPPEKLNEWMGILQSRRDTIYQGLIEMNGVESILPQGAFYIFPQISYYFGSRHQDTLIENAVDVSNFLLEQAHVATVPGDAFGSPEHIRLSYADNEAKLKSAIQRIKNALTLLH
jgi:aspartate aminotransferase